MLLSIEADMSIDCLESHIFFVKVMSGLLSGWKIVSQILSTIVVVYFELEYEVTIDYLPLVLSKYPNNFKEYKRQWKEQRS